MNKEEILNRLIQKSMCINAGGKGCYSPYSDDDDWFSDIDNLILMYEKLQQENKKLKDNWNELRDYLFNIRQRGFELQNLAGNKYIEPSIGILMIIGKMQELEKGGSNV